ncbi:34685_t:CDS:2, partial [Racocetra persica]
KVTGGTILPGGKMVMYGGCNLTSSSDCATSDVWSLDIGSNSNSGVPTSNSPSWSQRGECLGAREGVAMINNALIGVVSYRTQAISFGGKLPGKMTADKDGEVGVFDANGGVWVRVLPKGDPKYLYPKVRSGARMVAVDLGISNSSAPSIIMFGGEGLNGTNSFYNDMWLLTLSDGVSKGNSTTSSGMDFLKCISPLVGIGTPLSPSPSPGLGPFGPQFADAAININHIIYLTLSFIILPIATSIIRFGRGPIIAGIYAIFILLAYAFLIYGFLVAMQQVNSVIPSSTNSIPTSHFSTPHGLMGVILSVLIYIVIPLLAIFSCTTIRKFGPYTPATTSDDPESDENNTSFKNKFAKLFNLKSSDDDGKQTKSFEVSRPGNLNFQNDNYQKPTSMLNKPSSDSWVDKRKSVTIAENPLVLNNTLRNLNNLNMQN